jgi:hypothetical protein
MPPTFVIVGASLAGASAAATLRQLPLITSASPLARSGCKTKERISDLSSRNDRAVTMTTGTTKKHEDHEDHEEKAQRILSSENQNEVFLVSFLWCSS